MEQREKEQAKENSKPAAIKKEVKETPPEPQKKQQKVQTADFQKQQKLFTQIEKDLAQLNEQRASIEAKLADPAIYSNGVEFKKAEAEYKQVNEKIAVASIKYEEAFEKLMELEK